MKKIITLLLIIINLNLFAVTNEEVEKIELGIRNTSKEAIQPIRFKTKNYVLSTEFIKYNYVPSSKGDAEVDYIPENNQISGFLDIDGEKKLIFNKNFAYAVNQNIIQIVCSKETSTILVLLYSHVDYEIRFGAMKFYPHIYEISSENNNHIIKNIDEQYTDLLNSRLNEIGFNLSDTTPRFPYYNKEKVIDRLIETKFCKKEEIIEGQVINFEDELVVLNLDDLLKEIQYKNIFINNYYLVNSFLKYPLTTKTLQKYNDTAYYLQQVNANDEAIFLLEKIIEKFPNRTVAYLNLADAYNGINNKEKAKVNYEKYINLMKQENKENKIPKRVLEYK